MAAVVAEAAVLYFPVDQAPRVIMGLLLVPVMLRAGVRIEAMAMLENQGPWAPRGRVFRELRSQVTMLLEHVRRLNWIAVDAERGFRDKGDAMREMDAIEDDIRAMISDLRRAAGRATAEPEVSLAIVPEMETRSPSWS
jgi:hypothetical protein